MQLNAKHIQELEQRIREYMDGYDGQGVAVSIVNTQGQPLYRQFFGYRDTEQKKPLDADTLFGLASITKSFTALATMQLVERGILDLDAPVNRYLPDFAYPNRHMPKLWHLLCHSAGFPPQPRLLISKIAPQLEMPEAERQDYAYSVTIAKEGAKRLFQRLAEIPVFLGEPGEYLSYSNDCFAMLSEIIRLYGGEETYSAYVEKNIIAPLQMHRSTFSFKKPLEDENANTLYTPTKDGVKATHDWLDNQFMMMGGGSLKSTLADMERYVSMWLNDGRYPGGRLLSHNGIRKMQKYRVPYSHQVGYAFGLQTFHMDDITAVGHGGSLTGVATNILWSHDLGLGVVVLSNTGGMPVASIAKQMLKLCNGHSPLEPIHVFKDVAWTPAQKQAACGTYVSGEGGTFVITLKADQLIFTTAGEEFALRTVLPDLALALTKMVPSELRMHKREDGSVWAIGFGGRIVLRKE